MRVVRSHHWSRVTGLEARSLFLFYFFFSCLSSSMSASIAGVGYEVSICCSIPFLLRSSHSLILTTLSLVFALMHTNPSVMGVGLWIINKYLLFIIQIPNSTTVERQGRRAKKRKGIESHRAKPPTPSRAIDALIGDEEQNKKQKKKKKKEI